MRRNTESGSQSNRDSSYHYPDSSPKTKTRFHYTDDEFVIPSSAITHDYTALMKAVSMENAEKVTMLLADETLVADHVKKFASNGTNPFSSNNYSAMHLAASNGNAEILRKLLEKKVGEDGFPLFDPNEEFLVGTQRSSSMSICVAQHNSVAHSEKYQDCILALLKAGATPPQANAVNDVIGQKIVQYNDIRVIATILANEAAAYLWQKNTHNGQGVPINATEVIDDLITDLYRQLLSVYDSDFVGFIEDFNLEDGPCILTATQHLGSKLVPTSDQYKRSFDYRNKDIRTIFADRNSIKSLQAVPVRQPSADGAIKVGTSNHQGKWTVQPGSEEEISVSVVVGNNQGRIEHLNSSDSDLNRQINPRVSIKEGKGGRANRRVHPAQNENNADNGNNNRDDATPDNTLSPNTRTKPTGNGSKKTVFCNIL